MSQFNSIDSQKYQSNWKAFINQKQDDHQPYKITSNSDTTKVADDKIEISVNWEQAVKDVLDELKDRYQGVHIAVGTLNGKDSIQNYAAGAGFGAHLVISEDFLKQMMSSAKAFENGKDLLNTVLKQLSSQKQKGIGVGAYLDDKNLTYWYTVPEQQLNENLFLKPQKTLFDWIREAQEKAEQMKVKVKVNASLYNSPMQIYSKLTRAKSIQAVKNVSYSAGHKIYQLKVALSQADSKDVDKIRAVIGQLQRAVVRAKGKVRDLEKENGLKSRKKKAAQRLEPRREKQLEYLLKKKKVARLAKEHGYLRASALWSYYMAELERQKKAKESERPKNEYAGSAATVPVMDTASVPIQTAGGNITTASVTVSPSVSISIT